ncbi:hypothetical protein D3C73_1348560 [compost metagenome]
MLRIGHDVFAYLESGILPSFEGNRLPFYIRSGCPVLRRYTLRNLFPLADVQNLGHLAIIDGSVLQHLGLLVRAVQIEEKADVAVLAVFGRYTCCNGEQRA